jgi:hypothetical protein
MFKNNQKTCDCVLCLRKHSDAWTVFPQMLVFYTWAVRLLADTVSLFAATEDIGWLATETPQEGAALISGGSDGKDGPDGPKREDSAKKLSAAPQKSFQRKRKTATLKGQWPTNGRLS